MSARHQICVLAGDGIGPEVTQAAIRVLEGAAAAHGFSFEFDQRLFGGAAIDAVGDPYPVETREACLAADAVLFGAVGGPRWDGGPVRPEHGIFRLRSSLQAYANLRPIRSWWSDTISPPQTHSDPVAFSSTLPPSRSTTSATPRMPYLSRI